MFRYNSRWTDTDLAELRALVVGGQHSYAQIGRILGRPERSCKVMACRNGWKTGRKTGPKPFTGADDV